MPSIAFPHLVLHGPGRTLSRFLALVTAILVASGAWAASGVAEDARHPQDGPHVDVRMFIEDTQVVVRLEMNLVFLDHLLDFPREDSSRISRVEWEALQPLLEDHYLNGNAVLVDGERVYPELEKLQVNDPDLRLLPLFPYSGERGLRKIRFELHYPVPDPPPSSVSFEWDTYPPNILVDFDDPPPLAIAAELDAEGVRIPLVFNAIERGYTWHSVGSDLESRLIEVPGPVEVEGTDVPALAIGLFVVGGVVVLAGFVLARSSGSNGPVLIAAVIEGPFILAATLCLVFDVGVIRLESGPSLPDAVAAEEIFRPLHANTYRAFDFVEEGDIYDALARSVEGDFLDELYRTIFRGLVMQEEGGAVARIMEVRPVSIAVGEIGIAADEQGVERPVFTVDCRWQVEGVVSHWGHAHSRTNEYFATWSVAEEADGWRLTGVEILEQDRVAESSTDGSTPTFGEEFEL